MATLFVVATPIGNLEDTTPRALRVLAEARLVLAEDTRQTRKLLDHFEVSAKPVSLHGHNEARRVDTVLEVLEAGGDVALVSDAGTPLVSDPGERVVRAALDAGHTVSPVPGASAPVAALVASGLPTLPFLFAGFPPRKTKARAAFFADLAPRPETLVFFESPRRLADTLAAMLDAFGPRPACVARELTKLHETITRAPLDELVRQFEEPPRGEVTLVVAGRPGPAPAASEAVLAAALRAREAAGGSPSEIARDVARATGLPRAEIYARLLERGD
ncbi:MAG: 16S rRNA (cytidine(1402)-2'-O)-methyltransferase [Myxococcota bacterium]